MKTLYNKTKTKAFNHFTEMLNIFENPVTDKS